MFDQPHSTVSWPAALVVVSDDIVVCRIRVCREIALDEIASFICSEAEQNVQTINITRVKSDGMTSLRRGIAILKEVVWHLRRACHLAGSLKAKNEQIQYEAVVLENKGRELKTTNEAKRINMGHVLVCQGCVVLGGYVIGKIVIQNEAK